MELQLISFWEPVANRIAPRIFALRWAHADLSVCKSLVSDTVLGPLPAAPNKDYTKGRNVAPNSQTSCFCARQANLKVVFFLAQSCDVSMWFRCRTRKESSQSRLVDFKTQCWLEVVLPKCTPNPTQYNSYVPIKHSAVLGDRPTMNFCQGGWNRQLSQRGLKHFLQPAGSSNAWGTRPSANWIPFFHATASLCSSIGSRLFSLCFFASLQRCMDLSCCTDCR